MEEVTELENQVDESVSTEEVEQPEEKHFTQAQLDEIVKNRLDRERRKFAKEKQAQPVQVTEKPKMKEGEAVEDYTERLIDWKDSQRKAEKFRESSEREALSFAEKAEKAYKQAEKIPEFDRETFDNYLDDFEGDIAKEAIRALVESDQNAEIMAYMVTNPKEFEKLAELSPARQAAYIGKLETKLEKQTQARDPMTQIKGGSSVDNSNPLKMEHDQYVISRAKQGASWAVREAQARGIQF